MSNSSVSFKYTKHPIMAHFSWTFTLFILTSATYPDTITKNYYITPTFTIYTLSLLKPYRRAISSKKLIK